MTGLTGRTRGRAAAALGLLSLIILASALVVATSRLPGMRTAASGPGADGAAAAVVRPVVSVTPAGPVNPTTPVVVHVTHGTAKSVTVTNAKTGTVVHGNLAADGSTWTSAEPLAYAANYAVAVDTVGTDGTPGQQSASVATLVPQQTAYPSFIPAPGAAAVGVGQPIVVRFDHAVTDKAAAERAMQVTANPPQQGSWFWMSSTEAHYRPQTYWKPNSTVTVKTDLYGVDLGGGTFGATDRSETVNVHDAWVAKADGSMHQMQIFDNGRLVNTMPISLGSPGAPSHTGPHVISEKSPSVVMDSCTYGVCQGQPGYYKETVLLDERISNDGEFVHSAPWSVGQQGDANVSHGCVNLSPQNAQWFYDHFGIGDVVEITNSGGPPLPVWDTYGDWELSWSQWQQGSAL